ncbi:MAG: PspC domain-containing protein [Chitinophagaceae bacterium]|nr:PspC domain-containing protein [Chitinophagaceae bacterium]MCW5925320.1 PspC domain-containing protein [Chitinophagaceae bacterium]
MKKVININFQGRVIPIEETAYETLKQYVESLRRYFAREEGRDEIINDIENRIAELFDEKLKKGAVCIADEHVNAVMASMGRPEDFEEQEGVETAGQTQSRTQGSQEQSSSSAAQEPRRLRRSENDTVLGGVCAGIAHYLKIDPAVVRIVFALIAFGGFGFGFLLYIILWIVLPAEPLPTNVRKRLYRDPDNKMIGGVASGLAAYFNIDTWIPRLLFLLPFIFSVIPNVFGDWGFWGPKLAFNGLGGTFFITYIILWIVLPRAVTATEKLEMRGEKIDLESIKNTVQEELHGVKGKAEKAGKDFSAKATEVGDEISRVATEKSRAFAQEVGPVAKKVGTGVGNAIGVVFKAFFLFIAAIIAFALVMVLVTLMYSGIGISLLQNFLLEGFWQNFLAWSVVVLFIGVPIIALLVWIARRIMRVKSHNPYLGYTFGSLWIIGLISVFVLAGMVGRNFRTKTSITEDTVITQPVTDNMVIKVDETKLRYYTSDLFDSDFPFLSQNEDSMLLNTIRVKLVKSEDTAYHIKLVKFARGNTPAAAENNAASINFSTKQHDSIITLPKGFPVSKKNKFRNQQVMVVVEVPVGKKIMVDRGVNWYNWFNINVDRRRGVNIDWDDKWDNSYSWKNNVSYIMTESGLERTDKKPEEEKGKLKSGKFKLKADENGVEIEAEGELENEGGRYRYRRQTQPVKPEKPETVPPPPKPAAPVTSVSNESEEMTSKREKMVKQETGFHNPLIFFIGK